MIYSFKILVFIFGLLVAYYIVPKRFQWGVLLLGSYVFYLRKGGVFTGLLVFATLVAFYGAKRLCAIKADKGIDRKERKKKRQLLIGLIIAILAAVLAVFKLEVLTQRFSLILPLGLSYYTFMVIGYLVDVYRGEYEAEANILHFALFTGYFPALIQGPINRYGQMRDQFFADHPFSFGQVRDGFWLFLWGLFKKLVIADRAGVYVATVMGDIGGDKSGSLILMAVILFVVQMYGDFSGGIDMVSGISGMFGITMYRNFNQPFCSQTIGEFWRRWHISLGNWIRDYVFYPLAFSKTYRKLSQKIGEKNKHLGESVPGMIVSVITFVIIGLWHNINVIYLCYGLWYGLTIGLSKVCEPAFAKLVDILGVRTQCFSWRMFRRLRTWIIVLVGESLCIIPAINVFPVMLRAIFKDFRYYQLFFGLFEQGLTHIDFLVLALGVGLVSLVGFLHEREYSIRKAIASQNIWFGWALTLGVIIVIAIFGMYGPGYVASDFIYGGI